MVVSLKDNFWDVNQDYRYLTPFKELYDSDENNDYTSILAWSIYLYCDPKSKFSKMPPEERKYEIEQHFAKMPVFEVDAVDFVISAYDDFEMTEAEKMLKIYNNKLRERNIMLEEAEYSVATAKDIDTLLLNTGKLMNMYIDAKNKYESEKTGDVLKGGGKKAFIEDLKDD